MERIILMMSMMLKSAVGYKEEKGDHDDRKPGSMIMITIKKNKIMREYFLYIKKECCKMYEKKLKTNKKKIKRKKKEFRG